MRIYNGKESFKKNNGKEHRTFQMGIRIHNHRMDNFSVVSHNQHKLSEVIVMLSAKSRHIPCISRYIIIIIILRM